MKKISLLGCGWLGLPLAKVLVQKGFQIKGSTTSPAKIDALEKEKIIPFLMELSTTKIEGDVATFLQDSEILIIDIPPKLRQNLQENFVGKIQTLIPFIEKSSVSKVLFVSSTSVYGKAQGLVTEDTPAFPDSEGGKQLLIVEKLLHDNANFKTTVLRFGGLTGVDRNPVRFLAGKENLPNPQSPINFIHQRDCIGIIEKIIATHSWDKTFNAVSPHHPTRQEYYQKKALELGLQPPTFDASSTEIGKTISSDTIASVLNYTFVETP